jgi:RNA polymerase sigma factor (TIGR02999 family)
MDDSAPGDVTLLLQAWADGDQQALDELFPLVYTEMHRVAHNALRRETAGRLQSTELVNEAYLRLARQKRVRWQNRAHFLGIASQVMRRILVDLARKRQADKRGSGLPPVTLDTVMIASPEVPVEVVELDEALRRLTVLDPRQGQLVELRFFGGLSVEETAEVMQISGRTVKREWSSARAWLRRELSSAQPGKPRPA